MEESKTLEPDKRYMYTSLQMEKLSSPRHSPGLKKTLYIMYTLKGFIDCSNIFK